ncbi:universal stress protein [Synechococcus sp. PCC 7336]|uniref:universal stress protein n=1 Tax=Synechococcus sp. PCC 7336 TaxID=195250 RepID=UPI00034713CB|nr:universal stress protein [Synechococcus sp. PCC 7336]
MFDTILFPVDRSRETSHAIELVADLAKKYNGTVILLSVLDSDRIEAQDVAAARQQGKEFLERGMAALKQAGVAEVRSQFTEGKVAFVICDVADERDASLIVMGSRGVGLADEEPHDSVSARVIQLSPCPVLVVP